MFKDYDAMVQLVDAIKSLPNTEKNAGHTAIIFHYGFAMNRLVGRN
jgi:hypothetical protein